MRSNWSRIYADFQLLKSAVPKEARILDIGAVPPLLAALLWQEGYTSITVADPNASAFRGFFDHANVRHLDLDLLNHFDDSLRGKFDAVCFNEVIEHLSGNLLEALGRVADCVCPGGRLLVTTPNLRSLTGLYALFVVGSGLASKPYETVRAQYERAGAKYGYYGHLREFTPREVVDLVGSFGFRVERIRFQRNYTRPSIVFRLVSLVEILFPRHRLFAKYLFVKEGEPPAGSRRT